LMGTLNPTRSLTEAAAWINDAVKERLLTWCLHLCFRQPWRHLDIRCVKWQHVVSALRLIAATGSVKTLSCHFSLSILFSPVRASGVVRIDPLYFLAGCRKKRLNQALSVLSLSLGFS